jgi:thymidylate kinase
VGEDDVTVPPRPASPAPEPARDLLGAVFAGLDSAAVRWCLLRPVAERDRPEGDVDLLVARADLPRAVAAVRTCGLVPLAAYGRGSHRFFLGFDPGAGRFVELDVVTELAYGPHFTVRSRAEGRCLAGRRRAGAAWVLSQEDEFWALLLHCALDRRAVDGRHAERLARLAGSASLGSALVRAWPDQIDLFAHLLTAARAGDWVAVVRQGDELLLRWRRAHRLQAAWGSARGALLRAAERPLQAWGRRGASVALLGPDGAGKSTLAEGIEASFCFPVRRVYMGLWQRRETVSGTHRVVLEVALRPLVVWRRYLGSVGHRAIGRLVVFDRYVYDAMVPPTGPLVRLKRPYFRLLSRLCPAPGLVLVLDAPGGVMHARKGEHDAERLEAEREQFARLLRRLPNAERVDAARPPEIVLADVLGRIWRRYAERVPRMVAR